MCSYIWVQVLIHNVEHTVSNYVPLNLSEISFGSAATLGFTVDSKHLDGLFTAPVLALFVHRHCFQTLLDIHAVDLHEKLQFTWLIKDVGSLLLFLEVFHLFINILHVIQLLGRLGQGALSHLLKLRRLGLFSVLLVLFFQLVKLLFENLVVLRPISPGSRKSTLYSLLVRNLVQVLVRVRLNRLLVLGSVLLHGRGRWNTEFCEVGTCLLRALVSMGVDNAKAQHRCRRLFCVEYILDLTLKFEEIILTQINILYLQSDGLFYYGFQVLSDLLLSTRISLILILIHMAVIILYFDSHFSVFLYIVQQLEPRFKETTINLHFIFYWCRVCIRKYRCKLANWNFEFHRMRVRSWLWPRLILSCQVAVPYTAFECYHSVGP